MGSPVGVRERVTRGVDVGNGGCFSDMPKERGLRVLHSRLLKACHPVPSFFGMEGMKCQDVSTTQGSSEPQQAPVLPPVNVCTPALQSPACMVQGQTSTASSLICS